MVEYSGEKTISLNHITSDWPKSTGNGVSLAGSGPKRQRVQGTRSLRSQGAPTRSYGSGKQRVGPLDTGEKNTSKAGSDDPTVEATELKAADLPDEVLETLVAPASADTDNIIDTSESCPEAEEAADEITEAERTEAGTEEIYPTSDETEELTVEEGSAAEDPAPEQGPEILEEALGPEEESSEAEEAPAGARPKKNRNRPLLILPADGPDKIRCL